MNQNDYLLIIVGAFFVYFNFFAYQIWFRPQKLLTRFRNRYHKLPNWYPFKGLALTFTGDEKGWIIMNKIISIFGEIILIAMLVTVLISRGLQE